ncbi:TetR family transcriptional regulator [Brevibacillus ginsengisoli]|uniref:TetR family transcriptional regulator n=1 Tax=Brevibacillus ginsengisoli TaxID=363854 RepID=UPI003CECC175
MNIEQSEVKMRILQAAKKLFARQGYEGTTVRQICEAAGVNVALVSYHFGGKEKVFYTLVDTFFRTQQLLEQIQSIESPVEVMKKLIHEAIMFRDREPELTLIFQNEVTLQSPRTSELRMYTYPLCQFIRDKLLEGREQGVFSFRSLDYTLVFVMQTIMFSNCHPFFQPILSGEMRSQEEAVQDTVSFVLRGLGCPV